MDYDFADIKIVSLEDEMTVPSPNTPTLRYLYLKLSQTPPPGWQKSFAESRKIARHPKWRKAWIDRKFIVVECIPEELETHHLRDLKQDLAFANTQWRQYLHNQGRSTYQQRESQFIERDRLRDMKNRLNFD
jgi:hypothetical protein